MFSNIGVFLTKWKEYVGFKKKKKESISFSVSIGIYSVVNSIVIIAVWGKWDISVSLKKNEFLVAFYLHVQFEYRISRNFNESKI